MKLKEVRRGSERTNTVPVGGIDCVRASANAAS